MGSCIVVCSGFPAWRGVEELFACLWHLCDDGYWYGNDAEDRFTHRNIRLLGHYCRDYCGRRCLVDNNILLVLQEE